MATNAERIKEILEIRGIKPIDLSRITGIPRSTISNYMTGKSKPKQTSIHLMAVALNVDEAWIMGFDVPMERKAPSTVPKKELTQKQKELISLIESLDDSQLDKVAAILSLVSDQ